MSPRYGLSLPLFAVLMTGPALAQVQQQGPIQLTPTPPVPGMVAPPPFNLPAPPTVNAPASPAAGPRAFAPMPQPSNPTAESTTEAPMLPTQAGTMPAPAPSTTRTISRTASILAVPGSAHSQPSNMVPRTLAEALALTYSYQPALQAERAKLRATDETVPAALAGWRPTVQLSGVAGYGNGLTRSLSFVSHSYVNTPGQRDIASGAFQAQETLYNGGKTQANINRSKNQVRAERASLIAQEQTSFTNAVNAYVGVIQAQQQLALNRNNEIVLTKQLQATNDRFRVGEITRTDVAQAEAALAGAQAQRQTSEGQLESARGTFQQVIGVLPPADLVPPQPLALGLKSETEAIAMAATNNPLVISAQFNDSAAKDAVDVAFAQLLPTAVPLYQGGSEYAAVRQAKQQQQQTQRMVDDARRTAVQNAVQAWETLVAARAAADSTRSQIRANEIALEGVEREAIVGSRTTLDVLNAQQLLLNSRTTLVQNLAQLVNASYAVAAAVGRLTARDMHLPVPLYDETAYYNAVRDKWGGLGDYATNQPGR